MLCMAFVLLKFPKCAICITSSQKEIFKMYLLDAKMTINSPERKKKKKMAYSKNTEVKLHDKKVIN